MNAPVAIVEAPRAHAILGASKAERWLTCTPSARLEETLPDTSSEYAEEGTFAHELAEIRLLMKLGRLSAGDYMERCRPLVASRWYTPQLSDYVDSYVNYALERINAARATTPDALVMVEMRLDFSRWVPEGFGTGDLVIVAADYVEVIDLKYGAGVPVDAVGNPQLRLYGGGAWAAFDDLYDVRRVITTIVQPRLDSISTDEITAAELADWLEGHVAPRAKQAWAGVGGFVPSEKGCRFCKAKATCRARADLALEMARFDFAKPELLSAEEVAEILGRADELARWAGDVKDWALSQATAGTTFPGWKLVEGRSNRRYSDPDQVARRLTDAGLDEALIFERSLLGVSALEKTIGKKRFAELLDGLIEKPAGKPVLAPVADKRPEFDPAASAAADFL